MDLQLQAWLIYAGIGLIFGIFPGYVFYSATVSMAVMMHNKDVPRWMIRLANGNLKTRRWDITPFSSVPAQHRAEFIGGIVYLAVALAIGEFIMIRSYLNTLSVSSLIIQETSYPVLLLLPPYVIYLMTRRYVYKFGEYMGKRERETRKNKGF